LAIILHGYFNFGSVAGYEILQLQYDLPVVLPHAG
jgi:PII-like signaling protein